MPLSSSSLVKFLLEALGWPEGEREGTREPERSQCPGSQGSVWGPVGNTAATEDRLWLQGDVFAARSQEKTMIVLDSYLRWVLPAKYLPPQPAPLDPSASSLGFQSQSCLSSLVVIWGPEIYPQTSTSHSSKGRILSAREENRQGVTLLCSLFQDERGRTIQRAGKETISHEFKFLL